MTTGIYRIEAPSGCAYIGQSKNCERRMVQHRADLKHNKHHNKPLVAAFKKYAGELTFEVVDECSPENLSKLEQMYINKLGAKSYNMATVVASWVQDPTVRARHSANVVAARARPETKAKVAKAIELRYSDPESTATWKESNKQRMELLNAINLRDAGLLPLSHRGLNMLYNRRKNKRVVRSTTFTAQQTQVAYNVVRSSTWSKANDK